MKLFKGN